MDKRVVLAVAGSGKTSSLVSALDHERRTLLLTYTDNNVRNLREKIVGRFGGMPENVTLTSYFTFLHSFCYRPFLWRSLRTKGMNWHAPPTWTRKLPRTDVRYYIDGTGRLYHNRLAKLLSMGGLMPEIVSRVEKYYDALCIDEIQDFAGHDFNLVGELLPASVDVLLVGDYFQHTFDTSRDGNVNANLHADYDGYINRLAGLGLTVDVTALQKSYRCSPEVCKFVSEQLGILIDSHRTDSTAVHVVEDSAQVQELVSSDGIVKLFYQKHSSYHCRSRNWGDSKGEDQYGDVCVVLNKSSYKKLQSGSLASLNPQTRNKLYVACTRARNDLYLVPVQLVNQ